MTTLQGGVSSGWGASSDPVPQTTGTNWGATLAGVVGNAIPYVTDMLTGNASFNSAPQPVQQPLQGGTQYQQSNYTNPTLPVQQNEVVQGIPQGSVVNTNYAPVQTNVDYTNVVNRGSVQTPNAPDFAQAPGGPTNPQFAVIQPGQNQGMPQATGPTAQPPGTTPIIGADGLIRIGKNTFAPNDVTAQGMVNGGDYGYNNQPAYQQHPQYMPQQQQQNPYFPQGFGPNPYVQNQLQQMGMLPAQVDQSPAYRQALQAQQDVIRATSPYVNNQAAYPNAPAMYATQPGWKGRLNRFAGAINPNLGAQMALRDKQANDMYQAQLKEVGDDRRAAFGHRVTAANNIMTQEGQNARQENKTIVDMVNEFYKNNPNNPNTKLPLIKDMMEKFPFPGPDRMRYIMGLNKDTGINLYEYSDMTSPDQALAHNNKVLQGQLDRQRLEYFNGVNQDRADAIALANREREQRIAYHDKADELRIKQLQNNNEMHELRKELIQKTMDNTIALKATQAERAQLELDLKKQFGEDMAEAQIAKLRVSKAATEMKLIDSNVQGDKTIVDEFLKLQNQLAIAQDPTVRAQLQAQMNVFGAPHPLGKPISTGKIVDGKPVMIEGSIPKQVALAIKHLTLDYPAQKAQLREAYKTVETLNKAAKAGGVLPAINPDGSLKATAGKLK